MDDSSNSVDLALLRNDPQGLILRHQRTIGIIVKTYIRSGMFLPSEFEEIVQQLNLELLEKLPRIRDQYNGMSLVRTYLSNIIRHACLTLHTKQERTPVLLELDHAPIAPGPGRTEHLLFIEHDIRVFRAILDQFHRELPKLLLGLKLIYRIPVNEHDVLNWWPDCPPDDLTSFLTAMHPGRPRMTERNMFEFLQPLLNKAEKKASSADSTRRWVDERIPVILNLLNGSPPTSTHTRETLQILLDDYFAPFLLRR